MPGCPMAGLGLLPPLCPSWKSRSPTRKTPNRMKKGRKVMPVGTEGTRGGGLGSPSAPSPRPPHWTQASGPPLPTESRATSPRKVRCGRTLRVAPAMALARFIVNQTWGDTGLSEGTQAREECGCQWGPAAWAAPGVQAVPGGRGAGVWGPRRAQACGCTSMSRPALQ